MIDLRHCDCMEYLATCKDNAFELAIVDPPYGINVANMNMGLGKSKSCSKAKNRKWQAKDWDVSVPTDAYFQEIFRVSENCLIWGGNYFDLPPTKHFIIWDKQIPPGCTFADGEMCWTTFTKAPRFFRYSVYKDGKTSKIHPTQKPVKLYEWLLMNYAKDGDRILDTHLGSGSIAIACHNLGFDLVGCELDEDYYNAACKRLKQHQAQQRMF